MPRIPNLQGRSFQHWLVHQPVKLVGLGVRFRVETIVFAFIRVVEMYIRWEGLKVYSWHSPFLELSTRRQTVYCLTLGTVRT